MRRSDAHYREKFAQVELHDAEDRDVQAFRDAYDFGFDCFITDHPSVMSKALDKIKANN